MIIIILLVIICWGLFLIIYGLKNQIKNQIKNQKTQTEKYCDAIIENRKLKGILFTIREIAVSSFYDNIVGLVDQTLPKGFRISKEEHNKNLEILKKEKK